MKGSAHSMVGSQNHWLCDWSRFCGGVTSYYCHRYKRMISFGAEACRYVKQTIDKFESTGFNIQLLCSRCASLCVHYQHIALILKREGKTFSIIMICNPTQLDRFWLFNLIEVGAGRKCFWKKKSFYLWCACVFHMLPWVRAKLTCWQNGLVNIDLLLLKWCMKLPALLSVLSQLPAQIKYFFIIKEIKL